ncbi:hypothetical protein ABTD94_21905, partial [Acinetobacter baumannii]
FKTINDVRYPEDVERALKLKKANRKPPSPSWLRRKLVAIGSWLNSRIFARLRSMLTFKFRLRLRFNNIAARLRGGKKAMVQ